MMTRDDKSAVILGLRKRHRLLAAFLEAADKLDHRRTAIGEMPKLVDVEPCQASTPPALPQLAPSPFLAFALRRANLVALAEPVRLAEAWHFRADSFRPAGGVDEKGPPWSD